MEIYVIGSLRNPRVPEVANTLRLHGISAFDDWYSAGAEADDCWKQYEVSRGHSLPQALKGYAARNVFNFDKTNLDRCDAAILVSPAGKSAHLELGYMIGRGKPGFILLDGDPDRWDVMMQFATYVFGDVDEMERFFDSLPKSWAYENY